MKKFKLWSGLGLAFIAIVTFSLSIFLAKPSDAVSVRNAQMIELGIIDEVKSAEDLGLGHLLRRPPQLTANLINNIRMAEESVAVLPENISVGVPLGTNSPVGRGDLLQDNGDTRLNSNLIATDTVNNAGQTEPLTPGQEAGMFAVEREGGGTLGKSFQGFVNPNESLIADASGSFLQARKVPVVDLIVLHKRNGRRYLVQNVVADAFCRDALNAVLNRTQIDMRTRKRI